MANVDWQATYYLMRESLINHAKTSFNDVAIFDWPKIISYSAAGRYRMADLFKPVAMATSLKDVFAWLIKLSIII